MSHAQALMWGGAGAALATAVLAGWREHARKRRRDPDAVGMMPWATVQMLALIVAGVAAFAAPRL